MRRLFPPVAYGVLAVILTWPAARTPGSVVVGAPRTDVWNAIWSLWWATSEIVRGSVPFHTLLLNAPFGGRLWIADPVNALFAVPIVQGFGPVVAWNLLAIVHLAIGAWAAHALARSLGGRGWIAGIGYGFSAMALGHLNNGVSEAVGTAWLPLALHAFFWAVRGGGIGRKLVAGGTLFLCAAAGWYAGVGAWILVLCLLPSLSRPSLLRAVPGLLLALGLTLPLAAFTRDVARAPDGLVEIKSDADLARIRRTLGGADPRAFVVPGSFRSPDFARLEGNPEDYVHLSYLGFVILGCALLRARRRPRDADVPDAGLFAGAAVCLVLSLGPVLVLDGHPFEVAGRALPLPWRFVEDLPGFDALSLLYRLAGPAGLCLSLLADLGVPRRWGLAIASLVALETLSISPGRHLPVVTNLPSAAPFETLAAAPEGAVINLPLGSGRTSLYEQTIHQKPLAAGLNTDANRPALVVLRALRRVRTVEGMDDVGEAVADVRTVAEAQGIRYVVLHRNALLDDSFVSPVRALKDQFPLLTGDGDVRIWTLW